METIETNERIAKDLILEKISELASNSKEEEGSYKLRNFFDLNGEKVRVPYEILSEMMHVLERKKAIKINSVAEIDIQLPNHSHDDSPVKIAKDITFTFEAVDLPLIEKERQLILEQPLHIASKIPEALAKSFTTIEGKRGYFKFNKHSRKIFIGGKDSKKFRLLQSLTEPSFGVHKSIEAIFEAIRTSNNNIDTRLNDPSLRRVRMLELISYTKKELQKNKELQGKVSYETDPNKKMMWLESEG